MTVQPSSTSETDTNDTPDGDTPGGDTQDTNDTQGTEVDHKAEAEKWKALARKQEARAKENAEAAKKLAELEEKGKSDEQRRDEALSSVQTENAQLKAENLRLTVALDKAPEGMPLSKVKKLALRLSGETREDLEADAEELFADFASSETGDENKDDDTRRRPTERLKPGGAPDTEPEETDPTKLAAKVPRRY